MSESTGAVAGIVGPAEASERWWGNPWLWAGLALIATVPFLAASLPPLEDLPGHMGRYHVMLDGGRSPFLQRYYAFHWKLVGNLGTDLLMMAFGPPLGVERGAWLIAALTRSAMVSSIYAVSKAVHGRVQPTAFLALPFVYATAFSLGFLNYDLGAALALLSLALWVNMRRCPSLRFAVFVPVALGVWVCHAAAWGVMGLLVGGYELQAAVRDHGWRPKALVRAALTVTPLIPPAVLSVLTLPTAAAPAVIAGAPGGSLTSLAVRKLVILTFQLGDRSFALDSVSVLLIWGTFVLLLFRAATISALALPAALMALATIIMPPIAFGIALADLRLAPVAAIVTILSMRADDSRWASWVVAFGLALTLLRLAVTAQGWHQDGVAYQRHLSALANIPVGARVLILVPTEGGVPRGSPPLRHLGDLALVRRDALVNTQFAISGAQLLDVKANADIAYHIDPSQFVASDKINQTLATAPLDHFDYAWVLGRYRGGPTPSHLALVYADRETRLFRIVGAGAPAIAGNRARR